MNPIIEQMEDLLVLSEHLAWFAVEVEGGLTANQAGGIAWRITVSSPLRARNGQQRQTWAIEARTWGELIRAVRDLPLVPTEARAIVSGWQRNKHP